MNRQATLLLALFQILAFSGLSGQSNYFFQDSNNGNYYDSGLAFRTAPSQLLQAGPTGDKIPTTYTAPYEGDNSLVLEWASNPGGDWSALVIAPGFPFQNISEADTLSFWCYAPEGLAEEDWPVVSMEGAPGNTKTNKYEIGPFAGTLAAQVWTRVAIPLSLFFEDPDQTNINFSQIKAIIFGQNAADGAPHRLHIDLVRTYRTGGDAPDTPSGLTAEGYDSHVELQWAPLPAGTVAGYKIYRSTDGGATFNGVRLLSGDHEHFIDFVRPLGENLDLEYRISAISASEVESALSNSAGAVVAPMSDEALLEMVQAYTFRYFWDFAHPVSGLIRERNTSDETVTMGGTGFGVMAILVGIERGFITYQQGLDRILKMVNFLEEADRFNGAFPHWMNGTTGAVVPFSTQDNGGDIVETAFLLEGLLTARAYFAGTGTLEATLREKITGLWEAVDWNWYRKQNEAVIYWHWSPDFGFAINLPVRGWNESMMVYLLGVASPTHPVPGSLYDSGWAGPGYENGFSYYGYELPVGNFLGGPLFFTHYSFIGFDPRYLTDEYTNYYLQNRNQTLINRAYCISNPGNYEGYGENCWGLTASDDPFGYLAHEPKQDRDNGTIAPTAALSSMPYTYPESMAALKHFYRDHGGRLWGWMGFYDAFNETEDWVADSYLAIDQGPIITMIENHRSQLLWGHFMSDPDVREGIAAIGFTPDSTTVDVVAPVAQVLEEVNIIPNPTSGPAQLKLNLKTTQRISVDIVASSGQLLRRVLHGVQLSAGPHILSMPLNDLKPGLYFIRVRSAGGSFLYKVIKT